MGLQESDDPYRESISSKFTEELTSWPAMETGCIFWILYIKDKSIHTRATTRVEAARCLQLLPVRTILVRRAGNIHPLEALSEIPR